MKFLDLSIPFIKFMDLPQHKKTSVLSPIKQYALYICNQHLKNYGDPCAATCPPPLVDNTHLDFTSHRGPQHSSNDHSQIHATFSCG